MKSSSTIQRKILSYAAYGFLLGMLFPVMGILYELINSGVKISFSSLRTIHMEEPLLLIIDLAPLVIASFSALVGLQSARLQETSVWIEKQVQIQASHAQQEQFFFEALITSSPFAVVQLDMNHQIISFNPAFEELFGYTGAEITGRPLDGLITSGEIYNEAAELSKSVSSGKIVRTISQRKKKDGSLFDVEIVGIPVFVGGEKIGILGLYHDISLRKETERALLESEARFKSLFDNSPISLWEEDFSEVKQVLDELAVDQDVVELLQTDDDLVKKIIGLVKILDVNQATLDLYNARSKSDLIKSLSSVLVEELLNQFRNELIALLSGESSYECEIIQKKQDGELLFGLLRLSLAPGYEDTWEKVFISILDITERKRAEDKLRFLSFHDAPTGLYNRAYFDEEMSRLAFSRQFPVSIIACDLDNLKKINDTLGHDAGDRAIKAAAKILAAVVFRKDDLVARIGGDEFAVILPSVDINENSSILERLEGAILDFNESDDDDDLYRPISLSYGFAVIPHGGSLIDGYKSADEQMYAHKMKKKKKARLVEKHVD